MMSYDLSHYITLFTTLGLLSFAETKVLNFGLWSQTRVLDWLQQKIIIIIITLYSALGCNFKSADGRSQ